MEQSTVLKTFWITFKSPVKAVQKKPLPNVWRTTCAALDYEFKQIMQLKKLMLILEMSAPFWMAILPLSLFYLVHIWIRYRREKIFTLLWKMG